MEEHKTMAAEIQDQTTTADDTSDLSGRTKAGLRKFRETAEGFRWDGVPLKNYKEEGTHFKDITRQALFSEDGEQPCELRYFEIQPGGHSTFERHIHTHAIIVLRGRGRAIVGRQVTDVTAMDLLYVPPRTWHQLQAADDEALGFVCQVPCDRDRPERPTDEMRREILADPDIGRVARL